MHKGISKAHLSLLVVKKHQIADCVERTNGLTNGSRGNISHKKDGQRKNLLQYLQR